MSKIEMSFKREGDWIKGFLIALIRCNHIMCKMPKSTIFVHYALGSVITKNAFFGDNCVIHQCLTIGQLRGGSDILVLVGSNVYFGCNVSVLCSPNSVLCIGDYSSIGSGSVVLNSVPSGSVVRGVW